VLAEPSPQLMTTVCVSWNAQVGESAVERGRVAFVAVAPSSSSWRFAGGALWTRHRCTAIGASVLRVRDRDADGVGIRGGAAGVVVQVRMTEGPEGKNPASRWRVVAADPSPQLTTTVCPSELSGSVKVPLSVAESTLAESSTASTS